MGVVRRGRPLSLMQISLRCFCCALFLRYGRRMEVGSERGWEWGVGVIAVAAVPLRRNGSSGGK